MNTSTPLDPRSLAHRLTTVGHALHHRLFAQLRDGDLHPKTVFLLRAIDGRIDAPWVVERLARGGKRVSALADRGWITSTDDGWTSPTRGRAVLDRADAARAALLADVPVEELERLTAALDAVSAALGLDETDGDPRGAFGPRHAAPVTASGPSGPSDAASDRAGAASVLASAPRRTRSDRASGAASTATSAASRAARAAAVSTATARSSASSAARRGAETLRPHDPRDRAGHGRGCAPHQDGAGQERGHHRGHRPGDRHAAQRAYERGFDAGFSRGRASAASAETPAAGEASATE